MEMVNAKIQTIMTHKFLEKGCLGEHTCLELASDDLRLSRSRLWLPEWVALGPSDSEVDFASSLLGQRSNKHYLLQEGQNFVHSHDAVATVGLIAECLQNDCYTDPG